MGSNTQLQKQHTQQHQNTTSAMPAQVSMQGQDWNTITFTKPKAPASHAEELKAAQRACREVLTERRINGQMTSNGLSARKLDEETEELKHQTVPTELRLAIQRA